MITRRFIRIKVFKLLFSRVHSQTMDVPAAEEELKLSLDKTQQLYYLLLSLPQALADYAQERIDVGLHKFHPTEEEAHPNMRFVQNRVLSILTADKELYKQRERGLNWAENRTFVKKLFDSMREEEYFLNYMNSEKEPTFKDDLNLLLDFYANELDENDDLYSLLEDQSIYWADDVTYVCNIILSVLGALKENGACVHPALYKQEEDKVFAELLLSHALKHYTEYEAYIKKFADNWDVERIAATDNTIIVLGVSEAVAFPSIPLKVTLNEMVELSKFFSTSNSRQFVNGVLDKILKFMVEEGAIVKQGRGLVDK